MQFRLRKYRLIKYSVLIVAFVWLNFDVTELNFAHTPIILIIMHICMHNVMYTFGNNYNHLNVDSKLVNNTNVVLEQL